MSDNISYTMQWLNDTDGHTRRTIICYDENDNITKTYTLAQSINFEYKVTLPKSVISRWLVPTTEERLEGYITDNYDRYIVNEYGSYIYQMIQEKAYDLASEVVEEAKEEYEVPDSEAVIEMILEYVDFDSLYDLIEDILHAPITFEEKLAEVGMSISDFL